MEFGNAPDIPKFTCYVYDPAIRARGQGGESILMRLVAVSPAPDFQGDYNEANELARAYDVVARPYFKLPEDKAYLFQVFTSEDLDADQRIIGWAEAMEKYVNVATDTFEGLKTLHPNAQEFVQLEPHKSE
jgi:hypothetical protein